MAHKHKHTRPVSHVAYQEGEWRIVKQSEAHYAIIWRNQVVYVGATDHQARGMLKALNK